MKTYADSGSPAAAGVLQSVGALTIVGLFAVGGQDPYTVVFSWTAAIATMGILAVQLLVCVAIVAFFRRDPKGFSLWRRAIAPSAAGLGLLTAVGLVVINLPLLAGSDSVLVLSFPYLVAGTGLAGRGAGALAARPQAHALRRARQGVRNVTITGFVLSAIASPI